MNASNDQESLSFPELAAGSVAVAAVVLIAYHGLRVSQPPDLSAAVTTQTPSATVSQARRHVRTARARARRIPPPTEVATRAEESSGPGLTASNPPASSTGGTKGPSASDFLVGNSPQAIAKTQSPDINGASSRSIRPLDPTPTNDATGARPPEPVRDAAIPVSPEPMREAAIPLPPEPMMVTPIPLPHEAERNPSNPADALWLQTKLRELGYYAGNGDGVWGAASRSALRDFKTMNGLQEDDKWDHETEQRLVSGQNIPASRTFIGVWAESIEECQGSGGSGGPLLIRSRGAETDHGKCSFRSVKPEGGATWRINAACSAEGQAWSANVILRLSGSSLKWSSERGEETYLRCLKPHASRAGANQQCCGVEVSTGDSDGSTAAGENPVREAYDVVEQFILETGSRAWHNLVSSK